MSEKNFDIFLNLSSRKLSIAAFKKSDSSTIFFKEYICENDLNKNELNFDNIDKIIKKNIFEIEKITGSFLNDLYLMIETLWNLGNASVFVNFPGLFKYMR